MCCLSAGSLSQNARDWNHNLITLKTVAIQWTWQGRPQRKTKNPVAKIPAKFARKCFTASRRIIALPQEASEVCVCVYRDVLLTFKHAKFYSKCQTEQIPGCRKQAQQIVNRNGIVRKRKLDVDNLTLRLLQTREVRRTICVPVIPGTRGYRLEAGP